MVIYLESATYIDRLYQAFKNKELIQFIRKEGTYRNIVDGIDTKREFKYVYYFKISEFCTRLGADRCATYNITFETV